MKSKNQITVYEHHPLILGQKYGSEKIEFEKKHLEALEAYFGEGQYKPNNFLNLNTKWKLTEQKETFPFYSLIRNGVKFCHFVGVLQLGDLIIEVLPKVDKTWVKSSKKEEVTEWRSLLIKMLQAVNAFDVHATSFSSLKLSPNSFLDIYYELFVIEIERLFHLGLIKKYRDVEDNKKALVGKLLFSKQIQYNLVHKERFYVETTEYDKEHQLHAILLKTLKLLLNINNLNALKSRINNLIANFPELKDCNVQESAFEKIVLNRKSQAYKTSLLISKMILLNFHPDVSKGKEDVVALLFNMNALWEKFVYHSIKSNPLFKVEDQKVSDFWKIGNKRMSYFKADIFITYNKKNYVIDTKWKNLLDNKPSNDDLRQMFAYLHYYNAPKTALLYPHNEKEKIKKSGSYYVRDHDSKNEECSVLKIPINKDIKAWQLSINVQIQDWISE